MLSLIVAVLAGIAVAYVYMQNGVPSGEAMAWGGVVMFMLVLLAWLHEQSKRYKK